MISGICGSLSTTGFDAAFTEVSAARPCPVCRRVKWCCLHNSGEYVLCQRVESAFRYGDAGWRHDLLRPLPPVPRACKPPKLPPVDVTRRVLRFVADLDLFRATVLSRHLGVTAASLARLDLGWNESAECYTFPMRSAAGEYVGVRYRFPDGSKRSLKGGSEGLFIPAATLGGRTLFVAEGPTDAAALLDCGLHAIGRPNCVGGNDEIAKIAARFRPQVIVVVCDRDGAGVQGGTRLRDKLAFPGGPALRMIQPAAAKDARACVQSGADRASIMDVLERNQANPYWSPLP